MKINYSLVATVAFLAMTSCGTSQTKEIVPMEHKIATLNGFAAGGYDVVAYFTQSKSVEGNPQFTLEHGGATWKFSSAQNRDLFVANPERYAPQFGGHCAFATSLGRVDVGRPDLWNIVDGRLYLNSNAVANVLWKIIPGRIAAGINNWGS